ncbi:MAG: hypothetical protein CMC79_04975 [Flavobacteriaceae bacterium]|nr:hypothetical protein [Flavobacteriaceae bacterium]|tara:strand:+ start:9802 stop:9999 length:198 start_codon:yes stop_codon:yes gene_type:complete
MKNLIISEILYWVIAVISTFQVFKLWPFNKERAYIFIFFGVLSVFMALFRRHYRNKYANKNSDNL